MVLVLLWNWLSSNVALLATTVVFLFLVKKYFFSKSSLPPGPFALPFLGSLPFIDKRAEKTFAKWADEYGPVMYVQLGSSPTIILSSYEAIETAFVKQALKFNGRYTTFFTDVSTESSGIVFLNDMAKWIIHRRFGLRAIGSAGQLGNNIEQSVQEEANLFCEVIRSKKGEPFIVEKVLILAIANVITSITIGERTEQSKYKLDEAFLQTIESFRKDGFAYIMLSVFPLSRFFPPISKNYKHLLFSKHEGDVRMMEILNDHEEVFDRNHPRDITDLYLKEMKDNKFGFDIKHLCQYLKDMHAAGTETTTTTVRWALIQLVKFPEIQKRVQREIDNVAGRDGRLSINSDLPYTKAVVQEVYRCHTVVPLSVPRRTTEEAELMGYKIPKNTQVIPNLWKIHHDSNLWKHPHQFRPSRHLDAAGKFVKSPYVIPFSIGQRNCLGENLARIEVFVFVATILQKFRILPDPDNPIPITDGILGVVYAPHHYKMKFEER